MFDDVTSGHVTSVGHAISGCACAHLTLRGHVTFYDVTSGE